MEIIPQKRRTDKKPKQLNLYSVYSIQGHLFIIDDSIARAEELFIWQRHDNIIDFEMPPVVHAILLIEDLSYFIDTSSSLVLSISGVRRIYDMRSMLSVDISSEEHLYVNGFLIDYNQISHHNSNRPIHASHLSTQTLIKFKKEIENLYARPYLGFHSNVIFGLQKILMNIRNQINYFIPLEVFRSANKDYHFYEKVDPKSEGDHIILKSPLITPYPESMYRKIVQSGSVNNID